MQKKRGRLVKRGLQKKVKSILTKLPSAPRRSVSGYENCPSILRHVGQSRGSSRIEDGQAQVVLTTVPPVWQAMLWAVPDCP